jgi:hypothetical protein
MHANTPCACFLEWLQAALNVTTGTLGLTNPWVFTSALTNTQRLRSLTSATSSTPTLLSVLWDKGYPTQQQDVPMPQPAFEDGTASVPLQVEDQNLRVTGVSVAGDTSVEGLYQGGLKHPLLVNPPNTWLSAVFSSMYAWLQ